MGGGVVVVGEEGKDIRGGIFRVHGFLGRARWELAEKNCRRSFDITLWYPPKNIALSALP